MSGGTFIFQWMILTCTNKWRIQSLIFTVPQNEVHSPLETRVPHIFAVPFSLGHPQFMGWRYLATSCYPSLFKCLSPCETKIQRYLFIASLAIFTSSKMLLLKGPLASIAQHLSPLLVLSPLRPLLFFSPKHEMASIISSYNKRDRGDFYFYAIYWSIKVALYSRLETITHQGYFVKNVVQQLGRERGVQRAGAHACLQDSRILSLAQHDPPRNTKCGP